MNIGITYNLTTDQYTDDDDVPLDRVEEFDSPETIDLIDQAIREAGHSTVRLGFGAHAVDMLRSEKIDFVFNVAEGLHGRAREAQVPALLEMLGIPCSCSDSMTLAVCLDKHISRRLAAGYGIRTPRAIAIRSIDELEPLVASSHLTYPLFVKPSSEGTSMGIDEHSKVTRYDELREVVARLLVAYPANSVVVEEYLPGDEYTVAVIGNNEPSVLGIMRFTPVDRPIEDFFFTRAIKNQRHDLVNYLTNPPMTPQLRRSISSIALKAYRAFLCKDVARVDIRLDDHGLPSFIEINPLPGMSERESYLTMIANAAGMTHAELIRRILNEGLVRYGLIQDISAEKLVCLDA